MKKFDLEKALNGAKLVTRNGKEIVEFIAFTIMVDNYFRFTARIKGENKAIIVNELGKAIPDEPAFDIFLSEEEFAPKLGDWVEVSNDELVWYKRMFVGIKDVKEIYSVLFDDEKELQTSSPFRAICYKFIRPIQDSKELTMQEIADKFGMPVSELKIKK